MFWFLRKVGDPFDPSSKQGPQINQSQLEKIQKYVEVVSRRGGDLGVWGGGEERRGGDMTELGQGETWCTQLRRHGGKGASV